MAVTATFAVALAGSPEGWLVEAPSAEEALGIVHGTEGLPAPAGSPESGGGLRSETVGGPDSPQRGKRSFFQWTEGGRRKRLAHLGQGGDAEDDGRYRRVGEAEADRGLGPRLRAVAKRRAYRPSARLLRRHSGVGRDRTFASVARVRREHPRGQNADVHHAHIVRHARGQQAAEVGARPGRTSFVADVDPCRRVQQVVLDLRHIEASGPGRGADSRSVAERGEADVIE